MNLTPKEKAISFCITVAIGLFTFTILQSYEPSTQKPDDTFLRQYVA